MPTEAGNAKTNIWLKPDQVNSMRDVAYSGRHGTRDDALVTILYDTGLRRHELEQVNRDMLDLESGLLYLPADIQKDYPNENTPSDVQMKLDPERSLGTIRTLNSYLNGLETQSPALFPSQKSDRMTGKAINDVVKRLAVAADVRPFKFGGRENPESVSAHTLRHSCAWRMLNVEKKRMYDVRKRLRHSTVLTTEREYDHFDTV